MLNRQQPAPFSQVEIGKENLKDEKKKKRTRGENNKTCTSDKSYRISENDDKKEVDFI